MPSKSPLLKNSIHLAFTASISACWATDGAMSPAKNAIDSAILRIINSALRFQKVPIALRHTQRNAVSQWQPPYSRKAARSLQLGEVITGRIDRRRAYASPEGRPCAHRLALGVDRPPAALCVLVPVWDQAPAQEIDRA